MSHPTHHDGSSQSRAEHFLVRPRVDALLAEALQNPLTTVIAGVGYGKTHAVSSVLESMHQEYAWLQLSEMDNSIAILWKRLIHAVEIHRPDLAKHLDTLGYHHDSPASLYWLISLFETDLKDHGRFVLVLDDFHSIQDETALSFFEKLITATIPNLSIVLISRRNPSLPLSKMLSRGLMSRIIEDDLRFTQDEMEAYFEVHGEALGARMSSSLYAYTEGWILAIYLVGLSLKRGGGFDKTSLSLANVDIVALVEEEIYRHASKKLQKFLITMSFLHAAPLGLLEELAKDTPEVLAEMSQQNLLIRYAAHDGRYRMHRILKDFLSERRGALTQAEIENMHLVAARWYGSHDYPEEAIHHYWKCGCYSEVFDIILSIRGRASEGVADLMIKLIEDAPEEYIKARPIMRVVRAHHLFNNNQIQEAQDALIAIRDEYDALPPTQENLAILGEANILLALNSIVRQNLDFVAFFKKASECLPSGSVLVDHRLNIAEGINVTGIEKPVPGELQRYQDALFEAAPYAAVVMNGCGYGMEYLNATDAAFHTGDMRNAEKYAYETLFRAQQREQHSIGFMAIFYLIRILVYKGDYAKIDALLRQMKEQIEQWQNADCMALYDIIEGWFHVKIGQPTKVAKWIMHEEETRKMLAPVILGREYLVRSDCLLVQDKYYELLGFMKQSSIFYESRGILYARIQNRITEAIIHHYLGDHKESMDALQIAYDLSHANNLVMQYIEYGSQMRAVMKAAMKDDDCQIPTPWLENILKKSSTYAKRLAQIEKEYNDTHAPDKRAAIKLSKREMEVLSYLCHGLTKDEIADACGLSSNSVRKIQQSVYGKLGANNGLDAVRTATKMGLI